MGVVSNLSWPVSKMLTNGGLESVNDRAVATLLRCFSYSICCHLQRM